MKVGIVGGLTVDRIVLPDGTTKTHMGGGGYFCSVVARSLGYDVTLQTIIGDDFPREWLAELEGLGIKVLPAIADKSLTFVNVYNAQGQRRQQVPSRPSESISKLQPDIVSSDIIQITPVLGEVSDDVLAQLVRTKTSLEVQGFIRTLSGTQVRTLFWEGRDIWLPKVRFVHLSVDEIICVVKGVVLELLDNFDVEAVCLTNGAQGSYVFSKEERRYISAFPVMEVDPTGCGDVFSITFATLRAGGTGFYESSLMASSASSFVAEYGGLERFPSLSEIKLRASRLQELIASGQQDQPCQ